MIYCFCEINLTLVLFLIRQMQRALYHIQGVSEYLCHFIRVYEITPFQICKKTQICISKYIIYCKFLLIFYISQNTFNNLSSSLPNVGRGGGGFFFFSKYLFKLYLKSGILSYLLRKMIKILSQWVVRGLDGLFAPSYIILIYNQPPTPLICTHRKKKIEKKVFFLP